MKLKSTEVVKGMKVEYLNSLNVWETGIVRRIDKFRNGALRSTFSIEPINKKYPKLSCGVHINRVRNCE